MRSLRHNLALYGVLLGALALPNAALAETAGPESSEIQVEAQRIEIDQEEGLAVFTGNVVLRHATLELRCERMTARVGEEGRLVSVEASGGVRIAASGLIATAGAVRYDPGAGRLILTGRPSVRNASGQLRGREIAIDVRSGRVSIREAQGVFRLR